MPPCCLDCTGNFRGYKISNQSWNPSLRRTTWYKAVLKILARSERAKSSYFTRFLTSFEQDLSAYTPLARTSLFRALECRVEVRPRRYTGPRQMP